MSTREDGLDGWILVPGKRRGEQQGTTEGAGASKKMPNKGGTRLHRPRTDASTEGRPEPKAEDKKTWKVAAATSGGRGQGRSRERKMRSRAATVPEAHAL